MPRNEQQADGIDWSLTTWEGSRREQLRRWAALPLERIILAIEEMEEVSEQFRQTPEADPSRASGRGASPGGEAHAVHQPSPRYPRGKGGGDVVPGGDTSGVRDEPRGSSEAPADGAGDGK